MRRPAVRRITVVFFVALMALLLIVPEAAAISFDDPDVFGPGEGWAPPRTIGPGSAAYAVRTLQEKLTVLGFRPGPIDGSYGRELRAAVVAFQKVHGLDRDGVFKGADWDLLDDTVALAPSEDATRVEINLDQQVLYLVENNSVTSVVPISSGRHGTPEGAFLFLRHVDGWRYSHLGGLYEPYYFIGGYAVHGSLSVPPYPASHGCVRVGMDDMNYLTDRLALGMPVYIYGKFVGRNDIVPDLPQVAFQDSATPVAATSS